jgi:hypothetical protein
MRYLLLIALSLASVTPALAQGRGERLPATEPGPTLAPAACIRTNLRGGGSVAKGAGCTQPVSLSVFDTKQRCSASRVRSCPPKSEG